MNIPIFLANGHQVTMAIIALRFFCPSAGGRKIGNRHEKKEKGDAEQRKDIFQVNHPEISQSKKMYEKHLIAIAKLISKSNFKRGKISVMHRN